MVEAGYTHADIADHVFETTGREVSRSAVSSALSRAGLTREGPRYREEIPWRVRTQHLTQYPARMLRLLGRYRAELELTADDKARLDSWLMSMEEQKVVVAYAPDGPGFLYVDADEVGDNFDGIPIRRRTIQSDEL
jgi:hypothetical protein